MLPKSRTSHAISNTIFGIVASAFTVLLNMVVRIIIVDYLGDQINGLNSLFQSTISVMALVQIGFSTAMVINLYKPVHDNDQLKICELINYYRLIYRRVAWLFLCIGIFVCIFLLDKIITTTINICLVRLYFILFVLSYFVNYRTYYKRSLLFAEQNNRISIIATAVSELVFRGISIALIIMFKHYYLFLIMLICEYAFSNWFCARYVDKHHPYIKKHSNAKLSSSGIATLKATIKPLMLNQIAGTVQQASQGILISMLLGNVAIVGYYGSYQMVTSTISLIMSQFGGAFTSGFGNLNTEGNETNLANAFLKFFFIVAFVSIFLCTCVACCIQDTILLLFGHNFILNNVAVTLIIAIVFLGIIGIPIISVQNALGLHRLDSMWMVIQAVCAIIFSYIGGKIFGMNGILMGAIIPIAIFTLYLKAKIITSYVFTTISIHYFRHLITLLIRAAIVALPTIYATDLINCGNTFGNIILKGLLGVGMSVIILSIVYSGNSFFRQYISKFANTIKSRF